MPKASFEIMSPFNFALSLEFARCTRFEIEDDGGSIALKKIIRVDGHPCFIKIEGGGNADDPKGIVHWKTLDGGECLRIAVMNEVIRMISADLDLDPFYKIGEKSRRFYKIVERFRGLKPILTPSVFESAAWAIVGQQVNLNFAYILRNRLVEKFGEEFKIDGRAYSLFPNPDNICRASISSLKSLQFSERKAEYLIGLAKNITDGELDLDSLAHMEYEDALQRLMTLRGIGVWSSNYILMRGAGHLNCLPLGDSGLHRAVKKLYRLKMSPDNEKVTQLAQKFVPFRSLYTLYLWCDLIKGER